MKAWPLLALCACAARASPPVLEQASRAVAAAAVSQAVVVLRCEPADAEVYVDGLPVGRCEAVGASVPVGRKGLQHLQVKKPGFQTWETWVEGGGARAYLTAQLQKAP